MFIEPAYKESKQISKGRGQGGLVTLWRKGLTKYVTKINCSSFRILATKFAFPSNDFLVINVYFPCDPRVDNFDEREVLTLLADLKTVIENANCQNILIAGDLNSDFVRNTRFTDIVENSLDELDFIIFWKNIDPNKQHFIEDVDYTFRRANGNVVSHSVIDHFASNRRLFDAVREAGVLHSGENMSNHSPIYMKVAMNKLELTTESLVTSSKVCWQKATESSKANYSKTLTEMLNSVALPSCISCTNLQCKIHDEEINQYTMEVLEEGTNTRME